VQHLISKMVNKKLYFTIFDLFKKGKNPTQISKELNISKTKLAYYIRRLKELGIVKKVGYGTWELQTSVTKHLEHTLMKRSKKIRGHAFIWTIKFNKKIDWSKLLNKSKLKYSLVRGLIPRVIIKGRKVWLGKKTITIYEIRDFYGRNAIESRKLAVNGVLDIVDTLKTKLGVSLGGYGIKADREHFAMIKNNLARQCNKEGEKIMVSCDEEGLWIWVDNSEGLNELEVSGTKALDRSVQVQNWWNDHRKNNFQITPTFIKESIGGMIQVQQMHSNNIVKHQKVLDEMLITLKAIQNNLNEKK